MVDSYQSNSASKPCKKKIAATGGNPESKQENWLKIIGCKWGESIVGKLPQKSYFLKDAFTVINCNLRAPQSHNGLMKKGNGSTACWIFA
jgi:hypothetical protein